MAYLEEKIQEVHQALCKEMIKFGTKEELATIQGSFDKEVTNLKGHVSDWKIILIIPFSSSTTE